MEQVYHTTCCIVGGGPAGAMLALLLARQGISVILLEAHMNFEREFRGDTLHPSVMEILDELDLTDRLLQIRHTKVSNFSIPTHHGPLTFNFFASLKTKFPYITVMAQSRFLDFITEEAKRYPNFRLIMGAYVDTLIQDAGVVRGVHYRTRDGISKGKHEIRAVLTVGADGRFSQVRKLAGFEPIKISAPIDVLWFRVSHKENDPAEALELRVGSNFLIVLIDRFDYWQVGCAIIKGSYPEVRAAGLAHLRRLLTQVAPELADRFNELNQWKQISVLSVESSRLKRWYRPGLLLIGDAAHVMGPEVGVGINYAIQDAVVASNVLSAKLKTEAPICDRDLAEVQRQREWPTRIIQMVQAQVQKSVVNIMLNASNGSTVVVPRFVLPFLRFPWLLALPARFILYGLYPPRLQRK